MQSHPEGAIKWRLLGPPEQVLVTLQYTALCPLFECIECDAPLKICIEQRPGTDIPPKINCLYDFSLHKVSS